MKTGVTKFLPKNDREREMMDFWYHKGYAEAELMAEVMKDKRKVQLVITCKKPVKKARAK